MLINNTLITLAATSSAYKIHRNEDSSAAIIDDMFKMQAVNQIMQELNALRMYEYMSPDYTSSDYSSSSDSSSMSSDDYDMFYGSFEPLQFAQKSRKY